MFLKRTLVGDNLDFLPFHQGVMALQILNLLKVSPFVISFFFYYFLLWSVG